jgi:cell division cycle protein 37
LESKNIKTPDLETLKKALNDLEKQEESIKKEEEDLNKKEKLTPWNVDTIAQDGFTKTIINTKLARREDDSSLPDEEKERRMKQFVKENEKKLKKYGMLRRYDDSKAYLQENLDLVCENTANYLVIWCINLEMDEVINLFTHTIIYILSL